VCELFHVKIPSGSPENGRPFLGLLFATRCSGDVILR